MAMKLSIIILALACCTALSAQVNLANFTGDWKIRTFTREGQNVTLAEDSWFRYTVSDAGNYQLQQVLSINGTEKCHCTAALSATEGSDKVVHDFISCSDANVAPVICTFSLRGDFAYEFKAGVLYLTNGQTYVELERR